MTDHRFDPPSGTDDTHGINNTHGIEEGIPPGLRDAFLRLDPPPGGLAALRARIAAEDAPLPARRLLPALAAALALAAAAAALALTLLRPPDAPAPWLSAAVATGDPALAALGLADPPAAPVRVAPAARGALAIRRVDTAVPGVVFYRAMRTASPAVE